MLPARSLDLGHPFPARRQLHQNQQHPETEHRYSKQIETEAKSKLGETGAGGLAASKQA